MNSFLKKIVPHLVAVITIVLVTVIYFQPQLEGKVVRQGDVQRYLGMSKEIKDFKEKTGETTLWTNAMFGGMPTYQINTIREGNYLHFLERIGRLFFSAPIGMFIVAMLSFYILMVVLGVNSWLSLIGAIAFGLTTNSIVLFEAGHETKLRTLSFIPLVAAGIILAFRQKYLLGGILAAVGVGLSLKSNHVQMNYYLFLTLLIYGIAQFIHDYRNGRLMAFLKASGILIAAALIGFGTTASNYLVTLEYSSETMRGKPILTPSGTNTAQGIQSSSETEGLSWDYAMQWSNGTLDMMAAFIPGVVGGGSGEKVGSDSKTVRELNRRGARLPQNFRAPLYWGALPFTSSPIYFGAVVVFLFLMGLTLVKGPLKWWLALGTLLTFMLSMGKNLAFVNEFFFNYVPLYNKFRTPNSVLTITSFLMPLLGFLALDNIVRGKVSKQEILNSLKIAGGITGVICLFFLALGPSFFSFAGQGDSQLTSQGYPLDAIIADRKSLMQSDAFRSLMLVLLSGGLIWAYIQNKIKQPILLAGIGVLVLFDLWTVDKRYLDSDSFLPKQQVDATFNPSPADQQILQDTDPNYRVFDLTSSLQASAEVSYFHKSLGGYHAAKLQRYQDIIDRHLTQGNQKVINMLNTKYLITNGSNNQPTAQQNPGALGNAWLISNIQMVNTPNEEIDALNTFDPAQDAVVMNEFSNYIEKQNYVKEGSVRLTDYKPNHLTYQSNTTSDQFAVFSEIWYGPNKGWQAYIDGNPVEHIRANYVLRAMKIPSGQHKIEFIFDPQTYKTGVLISRISSILLLLGLLGIIGINTKNMIATAKLEEDKKQATPPKPSSKKPIAKTTSKRRKKKK